MDKKYIIANWKMNMVLEDVATWLDGFLPCMPAAGAKESSLEIVLSPSYIHIPLVQQRVKELDIKVAAQDVSVFEKGTHTGEIGACQIKDFCTFCIVGHSERGEDTAVVLKKRDACIREGITPIVCFIDPADASDLYADGVVLTWEDPENISKDGVFNPKDPKEIEAVVTDLRNSLPESAVVLYGGSVNRQNIHDLVNIPELNGVLVGGASTNFAHFIDLVKAYEIFES